MAWIPIVAAVAGQVIGSAMSDDSPSTGSVNKLNPEQAKRLSQLLHAIGDPTADSLGFSEFGGDDRATLDQLSKTSLAGLEKYAMDIVGGTGEQGQAKRFLTDQLDPTAQNDLFTKGVEDPTLKAFNERLLPEVTARFGGTAAYGSDRRTQERQLTEDTVRGLASGRASFLNDALARGVQSSNILLGQQPVDIASLQAIMQSRPFSYEEWLRSRDTRLKALLAATGQETFDSYAVPPKDYSDTGFLAGAALGKFLQSYGAGSGASGGATSTPYSWSG